MEGTELVDVVYVNWMMLLPALIDPVEVPRGVANRLLMVQLVLGQSMTSIWPVGDPKLEACRSSRRGPFVPL